MMDVAKSLNKIKDEVKKRTLRRKMKRLAVQYVNNSRLIRRMLKHAEALKIEQRTINKEFHEIKKELENEGELSSDNGDPANSYIVNYYSSIA